jgi:hypothetical protein
MKILLRIFLVLVMQENYEIAISCHALDFGSFVKNKLGLEISEDEITALYTKFLTRSGVKKMEPKKKMETEPKKKMETEPKKKVESKKKTKPKKKVGKVVCKEDGCETTVKTKGEDKCSKHRGKKKESGRILPDSITKSKKTRSDVKSASMKFDLYAEFEEALTDSDEIKTVDVE